MSMYYSSIIIHCGKMTKRASTVRPTSKKGHTWTNILRIGVPDTEELTKRVIPKGGVIMPKTRLYTKTIPRCTGDMPGPRQWAKPRGQSDRWLQWFPKKCPEV